MARARQSALRLSAAAKLVTAKVVNITDSKKRPTLHLPPDKPAEVIVLPVVRSLLTHDPIIEVPTENKEA